MFCTNPTIKSRTVSLNLLIKPIPISQKLLYESIAKYNDVTTDEERILSLEKVFSGLTIENFLNMNKVIEPKPTKITLDCQWRLYV